MLSVNSFLTLYISGGSVNKIVKQQVSEISESSNEISEQYF